MDWFPTAFLGVSVLLSPHFVANRDDFRSAEFIPLQGPPTSRCRILSFTLLVRDV